MIVIQANEWIIYVVNWVGFTVSICHDVAIYSVHRSTNYGVTFQNETYKFPLDAVAHWYYVSKDNVTVCVYVCVCVV